MAETQPPLVQARQLAVEYKSGGFLRGKKRVVRALNGVDFDIYQGETLGVVGESGCGKTTLGRALLRLVKPSAGEVTFDGMDWLAMSERELRPFRQHIQVIFQNPISSLDPRMKLFDLVAEPLRAQTDLQGDELTERINALFEMVGVQPEQQDRFAHALSGGQAQRVAIARALALHPKFLVLDEPTSALDVSVQAQIINLLVKLQREQGLTYLFISHDLPVVRHISQRLLVMYLGEIVEMAPSKRIFAEAQHPYTQALLSATPRPDPDSERKRIVLEGNVPSPANPPSGCRFHTRCPQVFDRCSQEKPSLVHTGEGHWTACHLVESDEE